jgi:2-dehydropantoate 2-reductase
VPVAVEQDLELLRWKKLLINLPVNGLTVALGTTIDRLMADPDGRTLVGGLMDETRVVAAARGKALPAPPAWLLTALRKTGPCGTSTLADQRQGRNSEIETLFLRPVQLARALHVAVPKMEFLLSMVRFRCPSPGRPVSASPGEPAGGKAER